MSNYGSDFECLNDLAFDLRLASDEPTALAEALVRRLQGRLWHAETNGFDLFNLIGAASDTQRISLAIRAEINKDERVRSCDFQVSFLDAERLEGVLYVEPKIGDSFTLTLDVNEVLGEIEAQDPIPIGRNRLPFGLAGRRS